MGLQISPTPLLVHASLDAKLYITPYGDTVYYGTTRDVSSTTNDGSLTNGVTVAHEHPLWFVTAPLIGGMHRGSARIEINERDELEERLDSLSPSVIYSTPIGKISSSGSFRVRIASIAVRGSLRCTVAPSGSALTCVLKNNGVSVASFTIAADSTTTDLQALALTVEAGDLLSLGCTSCGSVTPAEGVVLQIDMTVP